MLKYLLLFIYKYYFDYVIFEESAFDFSRSNLENFAFSQMPTLQAQLTASVYLFLLWISFFGLTFFFVGAYLVAFFSGAAANDRLRIPSYRSGITSSNKRTYTRIINIIYTAFEYNVQKRKFNVKSFLRQYSFKYISHIPNG